MHYQGIQRVPPQNDPYAGTMYASRPAELVEWNEAAGLALYRESDNQGHFIVRREPWCPGEHEYTQGLESWRAYGEQERKNSVEIFRLIVEYINAQSGDDRMRTQILSTAATVIHPGHPHSTSSMRPTAWLLDALRASLDDIFGLFTPGDYCLKGLHRVYSDIKRHGTPIDLERCEVIRNGDQYEILLDGKVIRSGDDRHTQDVAAQWEFVSPVEHKGVIWIGVWNYRGSSLFAFLRVA